MKTRSFLKVLSAVLICAILAMFIPAAMAAETVVYTGNSATDYRCGTAYGRGLQITDEDSDFYGNIYVTSEYYYGSNGAAQEYFHLYESTDNGETFTKIGGVYDTENNAKKYKTTDNWATYEIVEENSEGATTFMDDTWSMRFQPHLFELTEAIGDLPKGTVLCAGLSCTKSAYATDPNGGIDEPNFARLDVYYSTDGLRTWTFLSHIADTSGPESLGNGWAIWEPFFIIENHKLYCFYSDERGMDAGGQKIVFTTTTDGKNWTDTVDAVNFGETSTDRPGMPVVAKMSDGRYIMTYEYVRGSSTEPYYRISDSIDDWDAAHPSNHSRCPSFIRGGSPYCTTLPNGALVLGAYSNTDVAVNWNSLKTNSWESVATGVRSSYTRCLFPLIDGRLFVVSGGGYVTTMNSLACGAVEIVNEAEELDKKYYKIPLDATMVTSSRVYDDGTVNVGTTVVDGNTDTFFDGYPDGYVTLDLGGEYLISAIGYAPRTGYESRMVNGVISGSADGESWTPLYTIETAPGAGVMSYVYADALAEAASKNTYRYIKYNTDGGENSYCNISELCVYALSGSEEINKAAAAISIPSQATEDITLPASAGDADISWKSSNPAVISNTGTVIKGTKKSTVTLTAEISYGDESVTREYTVTVPGAELPILYESDNEQSMSVANQESQTITLDKAYTADTISIAFDFTAKSPENSFCDFTVTDDNDNPLLYFNFMRNRGSSEYSMVYSKSGLSWDDDTGSVDGAEHHFETVLENGIAELYIDGELVAAAESKAKNISKINIKSTYNAAECSIDNLVIKGVDLDTLSHDVTVSEDGKVKYTAQWVSKDNGEIITAVYDKETGVLIGINKGGKGEIQLDKEGRYTVKSFIWNTLEGMKPLGDAAITEVGYGEEYEDKPSPSPGTNDDNKPSPSPGTNEDDDPSPSPGTNEDDDPSPSPGTDDEKEYVTVFDASNLTSGSLNDASVSENWSGWTVAGENANLRTYDNIDFLQMYRTQNGAMAEPIVTAPTGGYGANSDSFKISFIMRSTGAVADCVLEDIDGNYIGGYCYWSEEGGFWSGSGERQYCGNEYKTDSNDDKRLNTYLKSDIVTGDKEGCKSFTNNSSIMTITVENHDADEIYDFAYHTVKFTMTDGGADTVLSTEYYSGKVNGFKALRSYIADNQWKIVAYGNLKIEVLQ